MARRFRGQKAGEEDRERSGQLRPGRVKQIPSSFPRMTGTARNLLRLARMVARTSKSGEKSSGTSSYSLSSSRTSPFQRRAIVNIRYSAARTRGGWKAHGTYIERESAKGDRENPDAERFGLAKEQSLGSLADGWQKTGDRRLFKIILSPEDPGANLERTTQGVVMRIEKEVSGTVEWGAVVHRNTDHPHVHMIVRDRLRSGVEFTLPRDLIRRGLREAVQESLTRQLGPRTIEEVEAQKQAELTANRVTPLDRRLADRLVPAAEGKEFRNFASTGSLPESSRLRHLGHLGLATPLPGGEWQVRSDFLRRRKRYALPNARIMIHQPWGGVQGQATDISIQAKEILRLKDRLNEILAKHTGKSVESIGKDTDRDNFMSSEEAKNYGLVDQVVQSRKEIPGLTEKS